MPSLDDAIITLRQHFGFDEFREGQREVVGSILEGKAETIELTPALAVPAPSRPPIRAWLDEEGMPSSQVIRFQLIAPISAPSTVRVRASAMTSSRTRCISTGSKTPIRRAS